MTSFKLSMEGEAPASYPFEPISQERLIEPFLWKLLLLTALSYFIWGEQITIDIGPVSIQKAAASGNSASPDQHFLGLLGFHPDHEDGFVRECDTIDNLTFLLDPGFARRHGVEPIEVQLHMKQCHLFVKQFSPVAIAEMRQYGIPASILMAQALLASNAGERNGVKETNNFFLRKCTLADCQLEHVVDDSAPEQSELIDIYPNLWGSFRAQSLFLKNTEPFAALFQFNRHDYRRWAKGLAQAGYSTDPRYGDQLIVIIQTLGLDTLDNR